ncbi:putative metalloprotease with PDZ domain [Tenacibaculum skagerrakense]|uniref:Putative metalloprotease with PDZ domain n=1 Tax=Tenacibaculum skagerrakense TaxID=186571 RepID=A0A4V2SLW0_9FLAO|nr:peptidase M61 [Tenacibaculum skagerrakense]TCP24976.1 putative metalloprotease with PDZ domain [Tenacibaculum skagerrakense]
MNIHKLTAVAAGLLLVGCNATKSVTNDFATTNPIETQLDLTKVENDKVPVVINPGRFRTEKVTYRLPRVVQGTYSVSDFGKYVDNFQALDYSGNPLQVTKVDTNTWEISNAVNLDKVTYLVNDTFDQEEVGGIGTEEVPFSPSGTNIEETNYVLNLHGFIGYFDSLKNNQYKLDVVAPSKFLRTSALQELSTKTSDDGQTITSSYFAPRYFDITDNPMFYGELDVEEFKVGDIKIVLSVYSPTKKHSATKIKAVMEKMMQAQKAYLGSINSTPRYDIYLYLAGNNETAPKGFGALEHHTSTVVVLPEFMNDEQLAESMIDVVSHEFFHIVTPLSVHSEDVHYFDYNQPTFSKHLWMYEGVTEYFATLFQVNKDLVSQEEFFTKIMEKINSAARMNDSMSFTKMSENILEKEYHDQYINVYQKGALIGMCIDILMREESNGQRGILTLMKELSNKYGKNKPFSDDALIAEITKMTYPSVGEFLNTHVVGGTPIDYNTFFEKVGMAISEDKVKTNYIQGNGVFIVSPDVNTGNIIFNEVVKLNSYWTESGVLPNDIIKEINGVKLSPQNANTVFQGVFRWQPGENVEVKLERDGKEIIIKNTLTQAYTIGKALQPKADATQQQKELLKAWLKG